MAPWRPLETLLVLSSTQVADVCLLPGLPAELRDEEGRF